MIRNNYKTIISLVLILTCAYFIGGGVALIVNAYERKTVVKEAPENWGLGFTEDGKAPTGNASKEQLKKYDAYYLGNEEEKVIYLTFDAGYENGYTATILDALKKHNVKATFFLVGHFIESRPDLVKRMVEEGHTVANHTYKHPNMSKMNTMEDFRYQMEELERVFEETTGQKMPKYYRPPQGIFNEKNLTMAKELGYKTFFWSLAYRDWINDKQPSHQEAFSKLINRVHPGAIVLLHSTSKTNSEILDELLGKWIEMGYTFASLDDIN